MMVNIEEVVLRLAAAAVGGLIIGLDRGLKNKPVGMRTLSLVALGSATVAVVALEVDGMVGHPDATSRVVQGVVQGVMTGISFIGAGVILRDRTAQRIHGLTTAGTVWIAAAIGIACGLGGWEIAFTALVIALVVLVGLRWIEVLTRQDLDD
ncbi:MgtC/SapB transporter [Rhodovulum sp. PH10]|uniref:MgtC/SapB family protein n=1 Tax=Rhodovulum sp. PH10 TaxID=1187851 RepID=UPI00027C1DBD|nr:MgtC/SapB family protein [Rhodovulum sp. PH10]EJW13253.1 MgtC/SapB transporter [Rhodovulum sp. PH10]